MPRTSIPQKNNSPLPVVIVGAGPVGLFLANLLGSKKIPVQVFERRSREEILSGSRAIGITAPNLKQFDELGLLSTLRKRGVPITQAEAFENGQSVGVLDFRFLPKPWLPTLSVPQYETMRVLLEELRRFSNVTVRWKTPFVKAVSSPASVEAEFHSPSGDRMMFEGGFLIGCDGHRSMVRKSMKIPFTEKISRQEFLMADFRGVHPLGEKAALCFSTQGAVESFPMTPHLRRWIIQLRPGYFRTQERFKTESEVSREKLSDYLQNEILLRSGFSTNGLDPQTFQWFRPKRLESKNYFLGRVILCGDAAHVISPIGAQGMNAGFLGAEQVARIIEAQALISKQDSHSPTTSLASALKRYERVQKRLASRAGSRADLHMWIGTRKNVFFSFFRKWAVHVLLGKTFSPILARRFAMLDLIER